MNPKKNQNNAYKSKGVRYVRNRFNMQTPQGNYYWVVLKATYIVPTGQDTLTRNSPYGINDHAEPISIIIYL